MAEVTADQEKIRKSAERKAGKPAGVARIHQGGDVGIVGRDTVQRRSHGESGASRHEGSATRH